MRGVIRLTYALVDRWMASDDKPPSSVTLDIDSAIVLFNAHYDERCFCRSITTISRRAAPSL
jgi:transposase, IS4 family